MTNFVLPLLIVVCLLFALIKKINPFDSFIKGAKDGLGLFTSIFPSILGMFVAVTMLKASGLIEDFGKLLGYLIPNGMYFATLTPMMIFRPLSGSASIGVLYNVCSSNGPDSLLCRTASIMQASTDTTFYIITLYFTSVKVTKWRHSLQAGLISDFIGMISAIILALLFFS
ncbi:TPA: spore maturation protein [bacterium]|nr:spore maturation protein [bacterium]